MKRKKRYTLNSNDYPLKHMITKPLKDNINWAEDELKPIITNKDKKKRGKIMLNGLLKYGRGKLADDLRNKSIRGNK
jgi:hypothetical protein